MKFIQQLREGKVSRDIKVLAAEGAIPLELREQFEVLAFLLKDPDEEIRQKARDTLNNLPLSSVESYLSSREANPEVLKFYLNKALEEKNHRLFEMVVKNPSIPDELLIEAAKRADSKGLEILAENQVRVLASRELIETIRDNPAVSPRIKSLMEEWLRLYYREKPPEEELEEAEEVPELEEEVLEEIEELKEEIIEEEEKRKEARNIFTLTWEEIRKLPVPEKIKLALMGSKMHRAILIRDPNKIVVEAVFQSPKLTEAEIETFLKMKSLPAEVVKKIATSREWLRSYSIMKALVKHPKTPPHVVFSLLPRLMKRDLADIAKSREVPEVIRRAAQNLIQRWEKKM